MKHIRILHTIIKNDDAPTWHAEAVEEAINKIPIPPKVTWLTAAGTTYATLTTILEWEDLK